MKSEVTMVSKRQIKSKANQVKVYLEVGKNRTFAAAIDWAGWCRSGRDFDSALQSLVDYAPRYARVLKTTQLAFHVPSDVSELVVVERLTGNMTTNFGAPNLALSSDNRPVDPTELGRFETILKACWRAFDKSVTAATGHSLRTGPRGGGRDVAQVVEHVRDVDAAYLSRLGGKWKPRHEATPRETLADERKIILATLASSVRGEIPAHGPRGGAHWMPRYFVRRLAWHDLDHAWEIQDRVE